jgi:hypothetical protein
VSRHGSTGRDALVYVYGFFALAAGARALVQAATELADDPLPICLSAVAAALYVTAFAALWRNTDASRRVARVACAIELVGVVGIGTLSVAEPSWFPIATVWSDYGAGYGLLPLALPAAALVWLVPAQAGRTRTAVP